MAGERCFEHAELRVMDLGKASAFYKEVLGLVEIHREGKTAYFGCGLDNNYDLAVTEGGTGVAHFAVRVTNEDDLERYARMIKELNVAVENTDGREPGQVKGIGFTLPSGIKAELVCVEDNKYHFPHAPALKERGAIAPIDADHINLMTTDVQKDAGFLKSIGFYISDVKLENDGSWMQAFTRRETYHHDVAFSLAKSEKESLHHYAWNLRDFDHMKQIADRAMQFGTELEVGPGRHVTGASLFCYFWEPGGNRFEFSAEVATVSHEMPTRFLNKNESKFSAWGGIHGRPESFTRGS
ncbi:MULTISPECIES: VOC family protein [unclassified Paenibacillus]|uniref:VOC family protein n=1 Tax=unclassified Paenibacillus TaxID=185978 RepID=UPI001AE3438B|nr:MULTISPECIES: VOC family protein [unclassified Paenibacillus]MBP1154045.1 catechol 2,3-dioxygenase [Paenibacillus sp. PvP091]MBP1170570.1 catechol 2,3-dioxygenase [Paenibacillus sp. PvR098]MBP2441598.1 catechol 2,3-dioxygenase [Paenibacillus sp. PvP052]